MSSVFLFSLSVGYAVKAVVTFHLNKITALKFLSSPESRHLLVRKNLILTSKVALFHILENTSYFSEVSSVLISCPYFLFH